MPRVILLSFLGIVSLSVWFGPHPAVIACGALAATLLTMLSRRPFGLLLLSAGMVAGSFSHLEFMKDLSAVSSSGFMEARLRADDFPEPVPGGKWRLNAAGGIRLSGGAELSTIAPGDRFTARGYASVSEWKGREWKNFRVTEITSRSGGFPPLGWAARLRLAVVDRISLLSDASLVPLFHAMVLGNTAFLDYGTVESFRLTGVTHLLAISGLNVAIAGAAVFLLFRRLLGEPAALLFSCLAAVLCVAAAGFGASATRAGTMYVLGAALKASGRVPETADILLFTGAIMLGLFPGNARDIGFWLSYLAVAGLAFLTRPCSALFSLPLPAFLAPVSRSVSGTLGTSLAATIVTLPVMLCFFGGLSLLSLLANLLVIPAFNLLTLSVYAHFAVLWTGAGVLEIPFTILENFLWGFSRGVTDILSLFSWGYRTVEGFGLAQMAAFYLLAPLLFFGFPRLLYHLRRRRLEKEMQIASRPVDK